MSRYNEIYIDPDTGKAYPTDGCTVLTPMYKLITGRRKKVIHQACIEHDICYWSGGTEEDRLVSDIQLYTEIYNAGYEYLALILFVFVRLYGKTFWEERTQATESKIKQILGEMGYDEFGNPLSV